MAATDVMLPFDQVDNGGQTDENSEKKLLPYLLRAVNETFRRDSLVHDATWKETFNISLEYVVYVIHEAPSLLAPYSDTDNNSQSDLTNGLVYWVVAHIVRMLMHPESGGVISKSRDLIPALLNGIRPLDPYTFRRLLCELVFSLGDLARIYDLYFNDDNDEPKVELKRFLMPKSESSDNVTDSGEPKLQHRPIMITSSESCERLQANISEILIKMAVDIGPHGLASSCYGDRRHKPDSLWSSVASQMYDGEIHLKKVSASLAYELLCHTDLPTGTTLDTFTSTVLAMISFLGSGFSEIEGDYIGLEENFGKCLLELVKRSSSVHPVHSKCWLLETLLKGVLRALKAHGLQRYRTEYMKDALCRAACALLQALPKANQPSPIISSYCTGLALTLVAEVGTGLRVRAVVKSLSWIIGREITLSLTQKKSATEAVPPNPSQYASYSPVLRNVIAKVNIIVEELQNEKTAVSEKVASLQGLELFLEVVALCAMARPDPLPRPPPPALPATSSSSTKPPTPGGVPPPPPPPPAPVNLSGWLPPPCVPNLLLCWERALVSLCNKYTEARAGTGGGTGGEGEEMARCKEQVSHVFLIIARSIGSLVSVPDAGAYSAEVYQNMVTILSLHFMAEEMSWKDLKPKDFKGVAGVASVISELLDDACIAEAISVLALMPKDCAAKWRTHVITAAAGSTRPLARAAAVRSFPFLLYHSGPNANHLVYDVIHGVLGCKQATILHEVADITGPLACVVSRKAVLHRQPKEESDKYPYQRIYIRCVSCDNLPVSEKGEGPWDRPKIVDPNMFQVFLTLLDSRDKDLKIKLVGSLRRLFGHISVRVNNEATVDMMKRCLTLLRDHHFSVRMAFSEVVSAFISQEASMTASDTDGILVSYLRQTICSASQTGHVAGIETILKTIGQLGRVATGDLFLVVVMSLLESICSPFCLFTYSVAHTQLRQVASHKRLEMKQLYIQFARTICKLIAEQMHATEERRQEVSEHLSVLSKQQGAAPGEEQDGEAGDLQEELNKMKDPRDLMQDIAELFDFDSAKNFLGHSEKYILPHLIRFATKASSTLIGALARLMDDPKLKNLIARNIDYIFCHLVTTLQGDNLLQAFSFLEKESAWDLAALLRVGKNVDSELLLHLSSKYKEVHRGIKILLAKLNQIKTDISDERMAELLEPKLLGILVHFDNHLNNGTIPLSEKKQAFESVILLMKLMGQKHITAVRVRLVTTLRIGMKFEDKEFQEVCCRAWDCFVRNIEMQSLGPMLAQILVIMQPLLKHFPKHVASTLEFLILENREELEFHFHQLYFVPEMPELARVNTVLKGYISGPDSGALEQQLELLLRGVNHESQELRALALSKLRRLLHGNHDQLTNMITSTETVSPVISTIITSLLAGCRETDQSMRALYGACLGELGAIDPGRLELQSSGNKDELSKFLWSVCEDNFAVELINTLAKAFLGAEDKRIQDCLAFSIQELIRVYSIAKEEGSSISRSKLFNRFSDDVQEIMEPLTRSRYKLNMTHDWTQLHKPIYNSKKGHKFELWITTLTGYLTSKVKTGKALQVFAACRGVIRNDAHIALYLLPYVATQVLLDGEEIDLTELRVEMMAVLHNFKERNLGMGTGTSDLRHMSAQTVFSLLDHFTMWKRHRVMVLTTKLKSMGARAAAAATERSYLEDESYQRIHRFLEQIPQDQLATASFSCSAYTRALMHTELYIRSKSETSASLQEHLDFLQKLYVALDEPDGVAGIAAIKQSRPSLREQILAFEALGQSSDASVCYDQVIQQEPDVLSHHQGLLRCRLALGELNSAMNLANSIIADKPAWSASLNVFRVEAAWKLGQWDKLASFLKMEEKSRAWNVGLGKVLYAAKKRDEGAYMAELDTLRDNLMTPLSAASMEVGSYHRGYDHILRLHMLKELEQGMDCLLGFPRTPASSQPRDCLSPTQLLKQWQDRLQLTQCVFRTQEPILTLRRTILNLAHNETPHKLENDIGECWLNIAKVARECGLVQTAHSSLASASAYPDLPGFGIENAKWLWDRGDYDMAQSCLERTIEEFYPDKVKISDSATNPEVKLACAKVLLLLCQYHEETSSLESNAIVKQYKEVIKVNNRWEDAYVHMAKYYDKIMVSVCSRDKPEKRADFVTMEVQFLGTSLRYGNQYIYESMPRMLSLWLDFGADVVQVESDSASRGEMVMQHIRSNLAAINRQIASSNKELAPYQFLTAFPQLTSRICHAHPEVFNQLREIIAKVLVSFPQQAMWMMMAMSKSSYKIRMKRCREIFQSAKLLKSDLDKFLQDATKLTDRLLDLCNKPCESSINSLSISLHFKPLQRLLTDRNFSDILLPLQSLMTVTLPSSASSLSNHDPFPMPSVYISAIEDSVELLSSLQRPKKITLRGSDGRFYIMLCKPKDDLRKDARLMEFNTIVNKFLRKNFESRRRDLHIRTYTVTPLNEECGMLEWVSHTAGLRPLLLKIHKERGIFMSGHELRSLQLPVSATVEKKLDVYRNKLLVKNPPVFSEWFLKTFPDPTSWYNARLSYARTTAVMSMVGYILGLGDRHGENILLDSTNGDVVHVDFNCLFNKGENFDYPEIVPFRLTPNMVEAMGPTGYEGVYRRACEVTMRVMRNQCDPLLSVLKTFIYDPLVEWSKPTKSRSESSGETINERAKTHVSNIESRLKGELTKRTSRRGLPLSVEGHVNYLVKSATDEKNLCQMYIGWAPYL